MRTKAMFCLNTTDRDGKPLNTKLFGKNYTAVYRKLEIIFEPKKAAGAGTSRLKRTLG
jgi:hypothetical protein